MEMPHIGTHCAEPTCRQLDFLPFTCNLCKKEFCVDHHKYEAHSCPESHRIDVQVPICPLCEQPVPSKPNQPPDLAVNEHLENNCKNKNRKMYSNRCSANGCKVKELVPVKCDACSLNFCLRHRHPQDHSCNPSNASRNRALSAAEARAASTNKRGQTNGTGIRGSIERFLTPMGSSTSRNSCTSHSSSSSSHNSQPRQPQTHTINVSAIQGGMSEDEAMARALAASMNDGSNSNSDRRRPSGDRNSQQGQGEGETEDEQLARAIAASLETQQRNNNGSNSCSLS